MELLIRPGIVSIVSHQFHEEGLPTKEVEQNIAGETENVHPVKLAYISATVAGTELQVIFKGDPPQWDGMCHPDVRLPSSSAGRLS